MRLSTTGKQQVCVVETGGQVWCRDDAQVRVSTTGKQQVCVVQAGGQVWSRDDAQVRLSTTGKQQVCVVETGGQVWCRDDARCAGFQRARSTTPRHEVLPDANTHHKQ